MVSKFLVSSPEFDYGFVSALKENKFLFSEKDMRGEDLESFSERVFSEYRNTGKAWYV